MALAAFGCGVAKDEMALEGMLGVDSGGSSILVNSGCGTGEGLGERGIMPRDLSAAVACKSYDPLFTGKTYR